MKINPNDPAFPISLYNSNTGEDDGHPGIPIRLHIAAMIRQGVAASHESRSVNRDLPEEEKCAYWSECWRQDAEWSLQQADVLIATYNDTTDTPK